MRLAQSGLKMRGIKFLVTKESSMATWIAVSALSLPRGRRGVRSSATAVLAHWGAGESA